MFAFIFCFLYNDILFYFNLWLFCHYIILVVTFKKLIIVFYHVLHQNHRLLLLDFLLMFFFLIVFLVNLVLLPSSQNFEGKKMFNCCHLISEIMISTKLIKSYVLFKFSILVSQLFYVVFNSFAINNNVVVDPRNRMKNCKHDFWVMDIT